MQVADCSGVGDRRLAAAPQPLSIHKTLGAQPPIFVVLASTRAANIALAGTTTNTGIGFALATAHAVVMCGQAVPMAARPQTVHKTRNVRRPISVVLTSIHAVNTALVGTMTKTGIEFAQVTALDAATDGPVAHMEARLVDVAVRPILVAPVTVAQTRCRAVRASMEKQFANGWIPATAVVT